jgi:hypothetical protein
MPKSGGSRARTIRLRLEISRLLLVGLSERRIAERVGKSASTVHHHVSKILGEWQAETSANKAKWISEQLARLSHLESELWDQFELSKQGRATRGVKARGLALVQPGRRRRATMATPLVEVETVDRHSSTCGDPAYLVRLAWCIAERSRLLGLYPGRETFALPDVGPPTTRYADARRRLLSRIDADAEGEGGS